ncbi:MAG: hypothetical protein OXE59_03505 [Bacteroidetes bacterium]|nr:hypothetical protein [Bacteroidota bacterium]
MGSSASTGSLTAYSINATVTSLSNLCALTAFSTSYTIENRALMSRLQVGHPIIFTPSCMDLRMLWADCIYTIIASDFAISCKKT